VEVSDIVELILEYKWWIFPFAGLVIAIVIVKILS